MIDSWLQHSVYVCIHWHCYLPNWGGWKGFAKVFNQCEKNVNCIVMHMGGFKGLKLRDFKLNSLNFPLIISLKSRCREGVPARILQDLLPGRRSRPGKFDEYLVARKKKETRERLPFFLWIHYSQNSVFIVSCLPCDTFSVDISLLLPFSWHRRFAFGWH